MNRLFDKVTIWNIFDYTDDPEWRWELLRRDTRAARRMAIRLALRHPVIMLPVIAACIALNFTD